MKNNGWGAGEKVRFKRSRHWALASERVGARMLGGIKIRKEWPVEDEGGAGPFKTFQSLEGREVRFSKKNGPKNFLKISTRILRKFFFGIFGRKKSVANFSKKITKCQGSGNSALAVCWGAVLGGVKQRADFSPATLRCCSFTNSIDGSVRMVGLSAFRLDVGAPQEGCSNRGLSACERIWFQHS